MMRVHRLPLLVYAGLVALVVPLSASACRCAPPATAQAYKAAAAVVLATVEAVREETAIDGSVATFRVTRSWKGDLPTHVRVMTGTNCAIPWEPGEQYLLFLERDAARKTLFATRCNGTARADAAKDRLAWLNKAKRNHSKS